jgi:two-component system sensor histidine kinase SenX3
VRIEVSDNGIGIGRRAQRRIFGKFYQVDQTLSRRGSGCGLGLAIVKFILDAHGGSVSVKSQPGKGSTFTVRLPASEERNDYRRGTEPQKDEETAEGDYAD